MVRLIIRMQGSWVEMNNRAEEKNTTMNTISQYTKIFNKRLTLKPKNDPNTEPKQQTTTNNLLIMATAALQYMIYHSMLKNKNRSFRTFT